MFNGFHSNAFLSKVITSSFLTLIPKKIVPISLDDYILICLVGSVYKALAKLLVARLKKVLGVLISPNQIDFVPSRHLLEVVIVANKVVNYIIKEKINYVLFKVDFEKAYDKVSWDFFFKLLNKKNGVRGSLDELDEGLSFH